MIQVKVPATTANMGPGFDCIGMALQLYNTVWAEEIEDGLEILVKNQQPIPIPTDETNLLYQTICTFYKKIQKPIPGIRLIQEDYIPLTRGLGSSAACIVAGLMIANALSKAEMSKEELAQIAAQIEGHPDNTTPALLGGMVVGALNDDKLQHIKIDIPKELTFAVMIPTFPLSTEKARAVVPKTVSLKDCIFNTSRASLMVAAMVTGQWDHLSMAMEDRLHQPYRKTLIPDMDLIFEKAKELGAKGVFLSGAGPTLIAVINNISHFEQNMLKFLQSLSEEWELKLLGADMEGAQIGEAIV